MKRIISIITYLALVGSCAIISSCNKEETKDALVGTNWVYNESGIKFELAFKESKQFKATLIMPKNVQNQSTDTMAVNGTYVWESPKVTMTATSGTVTTPVIGTISGYVLTIIQDSTTVKLRQKI